MNPRPAWGALAAGLGALVVFVAYTLVQERQSLVTQEYDRLTAQADSVANNLAQQLGGLNRALVDLVHDLDRTGGVEQPSTTRLLAASTQGLPGVAEVLLFDGQGRLVATSSGSHWGATALPAELLAVPRALWADGQLHLSVSAQVPPTVSAALVADDGARRQWTAVAFLDTPYLERQLEGLRYRPDIRAWLSVGEARVLAPRGLSEASLDSGLTVSSVVQGGGFHTGVDIAVRATADAQTVLSPWNSHVVDYAVLLGTLSTLAVSLMTLLHRRQRRFESLERETAERLLMAHEAAEVGVWEYSVRSRTMTWDAAMYRLHGVEADDYADSTEAWCTTLLPEDRALAEAFLDEVGQVDHTHTAKLRFRNQRGETRIFRTMAKSFPGRDGHCERIVGIHQDITQSVEDQRHLKHLNWELKQRTQEAEQAARSKSQFLANMSHEIRTPMNAVLGLLVVLGRTELSAKQREYVQRAESAGRFLLSLLNDVLDFSKIEAGRLELENAPFSLHDLLRDLASILGAMVDDKPVEVIFDLSTDLPTTVVGDTLRLRQILLNLGSNAVKFTDAGHVVVSVEVVERGAEGVGLRFSVADTGIGIAQDKLGDIFRSFVQAEASTTRRFGGSGLGLSISQFLVHKMGGELRVESRLGEGTRFSFEVRLGLEPGQGVAAPGAATSPRRVLVADANPQTRYVLAKMIAHLGWTAETVETGDKLLRRLSEPGIPPQVVLVDALLPGTEPGWVDGLGRLHQVPHLVLCHAPGAKAPTATWSLPWAGELTKPITPSSLVDLVEGLGVGREAGRRHGPRRLSSVSVLVVEDHPVNRLVAQELLELEGATVTLASGGLEALEVLERAAFDCILMDLQMPGMDGFEATRRLRERFGASPFVVAVTANAAPGDRDDCLRAGMDDHVAKPLDLEVLVQTIVRGKEAAHAHRIP